MRDAKPLPSVWQIISISVIKYKYTLNKDEVIIPFHLDPEHNCPHNLFMVHYPQPNR